MSAPTRLIPLAVWAVLVLAGRFTKQSLRRITRRMPGVRRLRHERAQRHTAAVEAHRYAGEMTVAAEQATDTAERWQDYRRQTGQHTDDAWEAWQEAEKRLDRTRAAAAFPSPRGRRTVAENAARTRFLHRAAAEAVERGDLPATVMADLAAGEGGWNPRLHPVEQELVLHRAIAAVRYHLYRQAVDAETAAWHDAELAVTTRDSLLAERDAATASALAQRPYLPERRLVPSARRPRWVQQTARAI